MIILVAIVAIVALINSLRMVKDGKFLPNFLLSWKWLPRFMRSLEPYDEICQICSRRKETGILKSLKDCTHQFKTFLGDSEKLDDSLGVQNKAYEDASVNTISVEVTDL